MASGSTKPKVPYEERRYSRYMTLDDVAIELACTLSHAANLARQGKFKIVRPGGKLKRISRKSFEEYCAELEGDPKRNGRRR